MKNKKIKEWGSHRFCTVKVGWGGLVEEERRKRQRNAPKANRKPHKALKRRNEEKQRNGIKTRRVCVCNERHTYK